MKPKKYKTCEQILGELWDAGKAGNIHACINKYFGGSLKSYIVEILSSTNSKDGFISAVITYVKEEK